MNEEAVLFYQTYLDRKYLFDLHTVFNSKLSHTTIINNSWPEHDPFSTLLMMYSNCRTMVEGDPAFRPLIWSIQGSMAFITEYHIGEIHFLVLPHPF